MPRNLTSIALVRLALLLSAAVFANTGYASDDGSAKHTESKQLIAVLAERGAQFADVRGTFLQKKKLNGLPIELVSNGTFHFLASEAMQWHTLSPIDTNVTISAEGISGLGSSAAASSAHSAMLGQLVLAVFSGDLTALQRYFSLTASGEITDWSIVLAPALPSVEQQFSGIRVSGSEFTESVRLLEKNGDETHIVLSVDALNSHND